VISSIGISVTEWICSCDADLGYVLLALVCLRVHSHLCDDKIVALSTPRNTARQIYVLFRMNSEQMQMGISHPISYLTCFCSVLESDITVWHTNSEIRMLTVSITNTEVKYMMIIIQMIVSITNVDHLNHKYSLEY
jgi:hypothetical protein